MAREHGWQPCRKENDLDIQGAISVHRNKLEADRLINLDELSRRRKQPGLRIPPEDRHIVTVLVSYEHKIARRINYKVSRRINAFSLPSRIREFSVFTN